MSSMADVQQFGVFALVSYVPDPLGLCLQQLRQSLPGEEAPQPHITILPPRPLLLPVEDASVKAQAKLEGVTCFDVELGEVKLFPETNVLYLEIADGYRDLQALHALLNTDFLHHAERFEYSPHLTISAPYAEGNVELSRKGAENSWNALNVSRRFTIADLVFLWQNQCGDEKKWERLWTYRLAEPCERAATQA